VNEALEGFYQRLLEVLRDPVLREGAWRLLDCTAAWDGNGSNDAFIAFAWQAAGRPLLLVAVNFADHHSQCRVRGGFAELAGGRWRLVDLLGDAVYERDGNDLAEHGLYLDVGPWKRHVFEFQPI
jgi:hypothetical protein